MAARRVEIAAGLLAKQRIERGIAFRDPLDYLFPQQRDVITSTARMLAILAGRRGGKSFVAGGKLFLEARKHANSLSIYIALSKESARDIMWPIMKAWGALLGLSEDCFSDHTLRIALPNGSVIVITGSDDIRHIESKRGTSLACAIIDECGAQPDELLRSLVRDILRPALMDLRGPLWLIGTPGLAADGYWYELTGPERTSKIPLYENWNVLHNPHIPHGALEFIDILELEGWTAPRDIAEAIGRPDLGSDTPTPTFVREYVGRWCVDLGELVYPYSDELCGIDGLPGFSQRGGILYPDDWRYVIGVDIGMTDATALSVLAANSGDARDFVVQSEYHERMLTHALAGRIGELREQYRGALVVMDSGGMGKYHAVAVQEMHSIPVIAADKREKASHIRLYRDRMLSRRVAVVRGPCNDALRSEYTSLPWDKNKLLPRPGRVDHASDATLYGWRELRNLNNSNTDACPQYGSDEWKAQARKADLQRMHDEMMAARMGGLTSGGPLARFG